MKLSKLLSLCKTRCKVFMESDFTVRNITNYSKDVVENSIFTAVIGQNYDAHNFLKDLFHYNRIAVITRSGKRVQNYYANLKKKISIIETQYPIKLSNEIASLMYPNSVKEKIAVTGTNGKTSVADFVFQIWNIQKINSACFGTLGLKSRSLNVSDSVLTTMEGIKFHKTLNLLTKKKCKKFVTEASSIGLDQWRLYPLKFNKLAFTNLSRDHLDYHKTLQNYRNSKLKLFKIFSNEKTIAVINSDDKNSKHFYEVCKKKKIEIFDFGFEASFFKILKIDYESEKSNVKIKFNNKNYKFSINSFSKFDIYNRVCALLLVKAENFRIKDINLINKLKAPSGRLEKIYDKQFKIFIDYAHTPDALKNIFESLTNIKKKSLLTIIGCGGNRDVGKRNQMTKVALKFCDKVILADDNPRNENPSKIREDMLQGINQKKLDKIYNIGDREKAIKFAIKNLKKHDIFIITGKGHEDYQIINGIKRRFSDYKIVYKYLS